MYSVIDEAGEDYILDFLYDKYSVLLSIYQVYLALKYDPIFNSWIVEKWLKTLYLQGFSHFFLLCKKCCMERLG